MLSSWWRGLRNRYRFWQRYRQGNIPWDSGITPPEVRDFVEDQRTEAGRALDLGCGTGTNVLYLAQQGWQATGIDFIAEPIEQARQRATQAQLTERVRFLVGDVMRLRDLSLEAPYGLVLDIGCGHNFTEEKLAQYIDAVAGVTTSGSVWMWYAHIPSDEGLAGVTRQQVETLTASHFTLDQVETGEDQGGAMRSAWYWLKRR